MIGPLHRKLLRDLRELSGPITTIAVVVACGVSAFLSLSGTHRALVDARARYYTTQRMGEVFATAERAPESLATRIAALPGVSRVQTRVVTGNLTLHGQTRTVSATIREDGSSWTTDVTLQQPDFGIKPYKALGGALKVKPEVRVTVRVPKS